MAPDNHVPEVPDSEDEPLTGPNSPATAWTRPTTDHVTSQQLEEPSQLTPAAEELLLAPAKSAQETTLAELKAQRAALITSLAAVPGIQALVAAANNPGDAPSPPPDDESIDTQVMAAAQELNKKHIRLLHEYNEMKDAGQALMGLIADQRGVRIAEVQDEFGINASD